MRTGAAPLAAASLVLVAVALRIVAARGVVTPWIFVDELLHAELAKNVAAGHGFVARGHPLAVTYLYPAAIAPAWWAGTIARTYALAKAIDVVLMSLVAVPVYLWGRRLLSPWGAVLAVALVLALPAFAFTGTLSQENAFLPLFVLACFAIALALERPSPARQAGALAAIGLACLARFQGLALLAVYASVVPFFRPRRFWPSAAAVAAGAAAFAGLKLAQGGFSLGVYAQATDAHYSARELGRWLVLSPGVLVLTAGVLPACALIALVGRGRDDAERAFLAVTAAATGWLVVLAAVSASWLPTGVKERYMLHGVPLLLLAFVLWVERGGRRLVAAVVPAGLVLLLPFGTLFESSSFQSNAFGLFPFLRLGEHVSHLRLVVGLGAVAAAAGFALVPRRPLVVPLAAFLLVCAVSVQLTVDAHSRNARRLAALGPHPDWIDRAAGRQADVAFLNTTNFEPETVRGDLYRTWVPVWTAEFWNRSLDSVVDLGFREPSPLAQTEARVDFADGRIAPAPGFRYVVTDRRFEVAGSRLGRHGILSLARAERPVRLAAAEEGIYLDGTMGTRAAYTRWLGPRGWLTVTLTDARARVDAGRPVAAGAGEARIGAVLASRRGRRVRLELTPPFRIEITSTRAGGKVDVTWRAA